jgi:hypothetical protein
VTLTDQAKTAAKWAVAAVLALLLTAWLVYDPHGLARTVIAAGRGTAHGIAAAWHWAAGIVRN